MKKNVYWGFRLLKKPKIGERLFLTKVFPTNDTIASSLDYEQLESMPVRQIEEISPNMSIIWTDFSGYAVYTKES